MTTLFYLAPSFAIYWSIYVGLVGRFWCLCSYVRPAVPLLKLSTDSQRLLAGKRSRQLGSTTSSEGTGRRSHQNNSIGCLAIWCTEKCHFCTKPWCKFVFSQICHQIRSRRCLRGDQQLQHWGSGLQAIFFSPTFDQSRLTRYLLVWNLCFPCQSKVCSTTNPAMVNRLEHISIKMVAWHMVEGLRFSGLKVLRIYHQARGPIQKSFFRWGMYLWQT